MKKINLLKVIVRSFREIWVFSRWSTVSLAVIGALSSFLPLYQTRLLGDFVNQFADSLEKGSLPTTLIIAYAVVWASVRILLSIQDYFEQIFYIKVSNGLEMREMQVKSSLDIATHEDPEFQNLNQRAFNNGIWSILNTVQNAFLQMSNVVLLIAAAISAISLNWLVFVIVIVSLIPDLLVQMKKSKKTYSIWMTNSPMQRMFDHLNRHLTERFNLQQNKTLQATGNIVDRAKTLLDKFALDQMQLIKNQLWLTFVANIIAAAGFAGALYLIMRDVMSGNILLGDMVFLIGALGYFIASLNAIFSGFSRQYEQGLLAGDIFKVFDYSKQIIAPENPKKLDLEAVPKIEFRNVWFKYPDTETWILKNVNLVIKPGEKIALVGENGAGKTTLVRLLSRIYDPTRGQVLVNGIDLRDVDPEDWLKYMSILFQQYAQFDFPVKESIAMGRSDEIIDEKKVRQSAKYASAEGFIERWEKNYSQQLGREFEGGVDPSQGQQQKLAIARAIYRDALVLVFDEPTAAVDALSEARMFEQLEEITANKTLFLISHRFNTVRTVDRILVLENCVVAEDGSHDELLKKDGLYAKMFMEQAKSYQDNKAEPMSEVV